ncbi:MAG: hypothetical protein UX04_C0002G0062 [Microgenomates group bacterium GW2011_GWF2_45_18]|nr:MAG: hypothetical protein UW18_C0001G0035 [Microgenomates group bacterium GW2011_GWF1_44_10]KKU01919.1 MAG: hypothetical protein UX04_C0002G0062 [Microgenomates group bacterium GW2011_GWF2_45_18]OGJ40233.1 MAG: hypothetical protein A2378_03350 [Candidatus Pacebacteria bacterium RIFOXYB1_FULL_44_10]HAU98766.1 hypothetical protein [Candidatus Paceibacterota bacterium]HAX01414.1 hypothetical protein [Candidatus Paceibacterota bacterium]
MKQYLCIDYGTVRVGTAMNIETFAEPLAVFPTDRATENIQALIQTRKVDVVLIGIPDGRIAEQARMFLSTLQSFSYTHPVKWVEVDESLSSVEAHRMKKMKRGDKKIDAIAAALLLQEYLDTLPKD